MNCMNCGRELRDGDPAYGTILGHISQANYGFMPSEGPWEVIECAECYRCVEPTPKEV